MTIRLKDAALLDPEALPIPMTDETNWAICRRVHSAKGVIPLKEATAFGVTRGEINQRLPAYSSKLIVGGPAQHPSCASIERLEPFSRTVSPIRLPNSVELVEPDISIRLGWSRE